MHRRLQLWVLLQQCKGLLPRLREDIGIPHQVCNAKLRHAPLPESKKLAGPANTEIFLGDHKPVGRSYERVQPLPGRRCRFAGRLGLRRSRQYPTRGHQQTIGLVSASPDASAQLVQLRQPEPLGMLDHHDRGIGHIDPDLHHRRGDQYLDHPLLIRCHDLFFLFRLHTTVHKPDAKLGQLVRLQLLCALHGRLQIGLLRFFDERIHHIGLPAAPQFIA